MSSTGCEGSSEVNSKETIHLIVENEHFTIDKNVLMDKCQYFNAMFSGGYKESSQREIKIEIITASAFKFVLEFFKSNTIGFFDLTGIGEILEAVNFFSLDDLQECINNRLLSLIENKTCFQIYHIAKTYNLSDLMIKANSYMLHNFEELKDEHIINLKDINTLYTYLSHENLDVFSELDVFKAGCNWLKYHNKKDDILIVLSCILYEKLELDNIKIIEEHEYVKNNELALNVVGGIRCLRKENPKVCVKNIKRQCIDDKLNQINNTSDKETRDIIYDLFQSNYRKQAVNPYVVKSMNGSYDLMCFNIKNNQLYYHMNIPNAPWWGLSITTWKKFYLVLLGGVIKNKNIWNREIRVFDCLKNKWSTLPTFMPSPRRHATIIIKDDVLYVIGGFGECRKTLNTVESYDLKTGEWTNLPDLPKYHTSYVATVYCGELFLSGDYFYILRERNWCILFKLPIRNSSIMSHFDTIYFTKKCANLLCCWKNLKLWNNIRPESDVIRKCHNNVIGICKIGNVIYMFSEGEDFEDIQCVESCNLEKEEGSKAKTDILWIDEKAKGRFYSLSGCFTLPSIINKNNYINECGKRWLN